MRRNSPAARAALGGLTAALLLLGTGTVVPARADCAGPEVEVRPRRIGASGSVEVAGQFFASCDDTGTGCGGQLEPSRPASDIEIWFRQGDQATLLATTDADRDGRFDITVVIPEDAELGMAMIDADGTGRRVRITEAGG